MLMCVSRVNIVDITDLTLRPSLQEYLLMSYMLLQITRQGVLATTTSVSPGAGNSARVTDNLLAY